MIGIEPKAETFEHPNAYSGRLASRGFLLGGSGDLVSSCFGDISIITPIRVPFRVLISLLITYLLSPPTLQYLLNPVPRRKALYLNPFYGRIPGLGFRFG